MTGPIIPAELWPEGAVALVWSAFGFGKWIVAADNAGTSWTLERAEIPMPDGWDWRVPVMRPTCKDSLPVAPAIDLEQFRRFIHACGYGAGAFPERTAEADRLLALIDGQSVSEKPQKRRCPNNAAPGGCQLPNRFCTFPDCEKADKLLPSKGEGVAGGP